MKEWMELRLHLNNKSLGGIKMYRLKVKVNKRFWKLGINEYATIDEALSRKNELKQLGIISIIVNSDSSKLE